MKKILILIIFTLISMYYTNICMEVLKENDEQAREYNPEKTRMIYFFVGQVMKKTRGKANPAKTMEMLREELAKYNK